MPSDFGVARRDSQGSGPSGKKYNDLGLELQALTPDLAKQLGFSSAKGLVVTGLKEDSPAASAGVKQGDLIEKVGTTAVSSVEDFEKAVKELSLKEGIVLHLRTAEGKRFVIVKEATEE